MLQVQPREHHTVQPRRGTKLESNRADKGEDGTSGSSKSTLELLSSA